MHRLLTGLPARLAFAALFFTAIAVGLASAGPGAARGAGVGCAAAWHGAHWDAPPTRDARGGKGFVRMAAEASAQRVVYVGELHERADHVANLLELVCRMRDQGTDVAIGVEFLQQPFQPYVDDFLAGRIDEAALRRLSDYDRRWGYDFDVYAPVLRYARDNGVALVALNVPTELSRKVAQRGFSGLAAAERDMLPEGIAAAPRGYGAHVDAALGSDAHHGMDRERFVDALLLWDEGMAARAARFLGDHPGTTLVVLAGNGHVAWPGGIPERVQRRSGVAGMVVVNHDGVGPPLGAGSYALLSGTAHR